MNHPETPETRPVNIVRRVYNTYLTMVSYSIVLGFFAAFTYLYANYSDVIKVLGSLIFWAIVGKILFEIIHTIIKPFVRLVRHFTNKISLTILAVFITGLYVIVSSYNNPGSPTEVSESTDDPQSEDDREDDQPIQSGDVIQSKIRHSLFQPKIQRMEKLIDKPPLPKTQKAQLVATLPKKVR